MKRGIPASASKKSRQWLYVLVLSIAEIFRRALHLTPFDDKTVQRLCGVQDVFFYDIPNLPHSDDKIVHKVLGVQDVIKNRNCCTA